MPRRRSQQPPRQPAHPVAIGVPVAARPAPTAIAVPVTSSTTSAQQRMHVAPPAQETTAWTARLNDPDPRVRVAAVRALSKVDKTTLAQHADALIARLDDPDLGVRWSALDTLGQLAPAARELLPRAVLIKLEDHEYNQDMVEENAASGTGRHRTAIMRRFAMVGGLAASDWVPSS